MLDRQKGKIVFECDGCSDVLETGTADFDAARDRLRREDWASAKDGEEWKHFCPECRPNSRLRET